VKSKREKVNLSLQLDQGVRLVVRRQNGERDILLCIPGEALFAKEDLANIGGGTWL
jgi:hypothetical protein